MKNLVYIWITLLACALIISCKDSEFIASTNALQSDKTEAIKRGEPVLFTFQADSLGRKIDWKVSPAEKVNIKNAGAKAEITFQNAGNYIVLASNSVNTQRVNVTVDSSIYIPSDTIVTDTTIHIPPVIDTVRTDTVKTDSVDINPPNPINPDSIGRMTAFTDADQIVISAAIFDSIPSPTISLKATTVGTYKCFRSAISFYVESTDDIIRLKYGGVSEEFNCTPGHYQASSSLYHYVVSKKTTPLELVFNGVTYRGTITSDGKSFTIDWPDNRNIKFLKTYIKN